MTQSAARRILPSPRLAALATTLALLTAIGGARVDAAPQPTVAADNQARLFLDHGQTYARDGQWRAAIALYKNALDINPGLADAHFLLGVAYHQRNDNRHAVSALRRAGELDPRSARIFYNLGVAYAHTGEMAKEIAAYKRAIRLEPGHASAHYNLATAYWSQGRDGLACGELYQAGRLYNRAGNRHQAREMLHLIQRIAPDSAYREQLAKVIDD
jgi:tetratricopeptide (TPR) repeat protein